MKKLSVIGIGAGDPDHLTMQAVKALNRLEVVFSWTRARPRTTVGPAARSLSALHR